MRSNAREGRRGPKAAAGSKGGEAVRRRSFSRKLRDARRAPRHGTEIANTTSAKKAARKIARRTEVNKARRSQLRGSVRKVEEAIVAGDRGKALAALKEAEPVIMRAAQKGVVHKSSASRKVSRLSHRVAQLGK